MLQRQLGDRGTCVYVNNLPKVGGGTQRATASAGLQRRAVGRAGSTIRSQRRRKTELRRVRSLLRQSQNQVSINARS